MAQHLLIIAYSARAYAQMAAREGFQVTTLDAFADNDTRALAQATHLLKLNGDVVDEEAFRSQMLELNPSRFDAVLYGSIFDAAPDGLRWLERQASVRGNSANTLIAIQDKPAFFRLLQQFEIPYPQTVYHVGSASGDVEWLVKRSQTCGGAHVRVWQGETLDTHEYLQQNMQGLPVSLLFGANGKTAHKIGFNRLLTRDCIEYPFQYAGAVSQFAIPSHAANILLDAAQKLTDHYQLQGINSLDAILVGADVFVLELNPRLSASASLYPAMPLIRMQLGLQVDEPEQSGQVYAEMIIFADEDMVIPEKIRFPEWVTDVPVAGQGFTKHNPVCSVQAHADTHEAAYGLLVERFSQFKTILEL